LLLVLNVSSAYKTVEKVRRLQQCSYAWSEAVGIVNVDYAYSCSL